jgi:hypothetical protein
MGKLAETTDLIELYKHHVGIREVPSTFDEWACISIIAAAVGNRVWYEKFTGKRLCPNLYVVLLGPSACGKGIAIDDATLPYVAHAPIVNHYRGKTTAAFLIDLIGKVQRHGGGYAPNSCLYLITPELSLSVGSGPLADEFIKMMTELFTGGDYTFQHGTRTRGNVIVTGHNINWFAGSTEEWFVGALTKDAIEGGALGRIAVIKEDYKDMRIPEPRRSDDYEEIRTHIRARIYNLLGAAGPFTITEKARTLHEQWYMDRRLPAQGAGMMPTWKRQDDLILKLAMISSLSYGRHDLVITGDDFTRGEQLSYKALEAAPYLISLASSTPETAGLHLVREAIYRAGEIQKQALTRLLGRRGILSPKVQEFVRQLIEEGVVEEGVTGRGTWYRWKRRKLR